MNPFQVDKLLNLKKEPNPNNESDDGFRPKPKLGKLKIFEGNFWFNWWFNKATKENRKKLRTRHF